MKRVFLSFASSDMQGSLARIKAQAADIDYFDRIEALTEHDLATDFANHFRSRLKFGTRGFGYWCWKPQIVLQTLATMADGDLLVYADAGCHLNKSGLARLEDYQQAAKADRIGIVGFQYGVPHEDWPDDHTHACFRERAWTKGDLLDFFDVRTNRDITESGQVVTTSFIIRKSPASEKFISARREVFYRHFYLVDDSASKSPDAAGFVENRHDQSVFSLLCKTHGVMRFSYFEIQPPEQNAAGPPICNPKFPIQAFRDKELPFWSRKRRQLGKWQRKIQRGLHRLQRQRR